MDRKNIYIIVLAITTIIASCFAIYFFSSMKNVDVEVKVEEKIVEKAKLLDVSKNLNPNEAYLTRTAGSIEMKIENNKAYVANHSDVWGIGDYTKTKGEFYEIVGVTGNAVDIGSVFIPTSGYPIFVILMEDGTLQYTKFAQGDDAICAGTLEGYKDIVRIDSVTTIQDGPVEGSKMYYPSIVATDKDGNTQIVQALKYAIEE